MGKGAGRRKLATLASLLGCAAAIAPVTGCSSAAGSGISASPSPGKAITVPVKIVTHGSATAELVPVYIDGKGPYTFLLDTGSTVSSISQKLVKGLPGLKPTGSTTQIRGVATTTRVPQVRVPDWRLGPAKLAPDTVSELKLSATAGGVDGLLGSDELRRFGAVTINFTTGQLRLAHPASGS